MRRLSIAAVGVLAVAGIWAALAGGAIPYRGVTVKGSGFFDFRPATVQLRLVCPPETQSTPRPGDFSFCTGNMVISRFGRVIARGPFSIRTFDSHLEVFPVVPGGASALRGRRVVVRWRARSHDGRGRFATRSGSAVVVR